MATIFCVSVARVYFFTEALAEFQQVQSWEVKRVACYARAVTFTEAVASMVAMPLASCIHS